MNMIIDGNSLRMVKIFESIISVFNEKIKIVFKIIVCWLFNFVIHLNFKAI